MLTTPGLCTELRSLAPASRYARAHRAAVGWMRRMVITRGGVRAACAVTGGRDAPSMVLLHARGGKTVQTGAGDRAVR